MFASLCSFAVHHVATFFVG
uniref:Uncharacterized protein n=1 Tax=Anguilla anguilla TaxID=7936 RepID=A0A0E9SXT4_ANGAN